MYLQIDVYKRQAVLMWIGERITEKGVGNGISIVLTINIISRIPEDLSTLWVVQYCSWKKYDDNAEYLDIDVVNGGMGTYITSGKACLLYTSRCV